MIPVFLNHDTIKTMRRNAFGMMQILKLEMDKYKNRYPGYLQDREYLTILEKQMNEQMEIYNSCSESVGISGIHTKLIKGDGL